jgi:hypothetical protein
MKNWQARMGSNHRPSHSKCVALPLRHSPLLCSLPDSNRSCRNEGPPSWPLEEGSEIGAGCENPGGNGRLDQAYVETPDGLRIEIPEDKNQAMPIRNEHVHLALPEGGIAKAQAWYAKTFGGKASSRNNQPVDIPGVQIRFAKADTAQAPTQGRVLDHFGFDVKDHAAFVKTSRRRVSGSMKRRARMQRPAPRSPTSPIRGALASSWSNGRQ